VTNAVNRTLVLATVVASFLAASTAAFAAEDGHHPHHVGVSAGAARHNGKNSGFLGLDYVYRFQNDFAAAVFLEEVLGDFDIRAFGVRWQIFQQRLEGCDRAGYRNQTEGQQEFVSLACHGRI
jgi:hypothetical protein